MTSATDPARSVSTRSLARTRRAGATRTTVLVALAANAVIFVAKLAGGLVSGSTALLGEAAHPLAAPVNQGFLLGSIALAARPPSRAHPFGHGQQRYLWTFLAAVCMFVAGATFAIGYGIAQLVGGTESAGGFGVAWVTLGIGVLAEGSSWLRALRQTRREARAARLSTREHVRQSRDPSSKMVLFEDSAALLGLGIAAVGIGLEQITGNAAWDPIASIAIGVLLVG